MLKRILRKLGIRDAQWGDWSGLDSADQRPRYEQIERWRRKWVPDGSILDLGCGGGVMLDMIHTSVPGHVHYFGVDISNKATALAKTKIRRADAETIVCDDIRNTRAVKGRVFDLVVFNEVLYYLPDIERDAVNLIRLYMEEHLKGDGMFIVSVWHDERRKKVKNEVAWATVNEAFHDRCLALETIKNGVVGEWRLGLYTHAPVETK